jgi:hypothetical protein
MKKMIFAVVIFITFIFCGCGGSGNEAKVCQSSLDCEIGFVCNTSIGRCQRPGEADTSDSGDTSADTSDSGDSTVDTDSSDTGEISGKTGVMCDCFGKQYEVPTFASGSGAAWCKADADSDGIPNCIEVPKGVPVDTDLDDTPDYKDTDADGDGIPDSAECPDFAENEMCPDTNGDNLPNYRDTDSDGDRIPDSYECFSDPCIDNDEDGLPDYVDPDSDNDGIPDVIETNEIVSGDLPCYINPDSDGDGIPDSEECKNYDQNQTCPDADGDGIPDFKEIDSDGDGLPDNQEIDCGGELGHSKSQKDTDGDGFSDLAEVLVGSDPCNAAEGVKDKGVKFYFELPYEGEKQNDTLVFSPQVQKADIFFNVDTTGSMGQEIDKLKSSLSSTIIPDVKTKISDSAFGVSYFDDFPVNGYGSEYSNFLGTCHDLPFGLLQSPTTDTSVAQAGVNQLSLHCGNDGPESGYESLYKIATGTTLSWSGGSVAAGGVGFREGTIPIVFHITDAAAHDSNNTPYDSSYVYTIFNQSQVISAMNTIGAKVVSVLSSSGYNTSNARNQLTAISNGTGAVVPSCANAGRTTLIYEINGDDGSGLDSSTVNGVDALIKYASFDVRVEPAKDADNSSLDTSCFLKKITALEYIPVDDCAATIVATPAAFNGADYNNGFSNFSTGTSTAGTPGNKLTFNVEAMNDCFPEEKEAKMFQAYINVIDNKTGSVLDSQPVTVIVPAKTTTENY